MDPSESAVKSLQCTVLLLAALAVPLHAAPAPLTRWAVVGTPAVEKTGVTHLLTAELSKEHGLELVERGDIQRAFQEKEMTVLGAAGAAATRVRMGQILRADALALLSVTERDGRTALQVVLCDCRQGARLVIDFCTAPATDPAKATREARALIRTTRERFPAGVQKVIGVSPFVSRDLTHELDHYQIAFCRLLQNTLAAQPGVAVIEVEEAHAIRHELAGATESVAARHVPAMVAGEYGVERDESGAPTLSLTTRLTGGGDVITSFAGTGLAPTRVGEYLSGELGPAIVAALGRAGGRGITPEQQFEALIGRADRFARLGAWIEAIGLREAALLLNPMSGAQRRTLLAEYRRDICRNFAPAETAEREAECARRIRAWSVARQHLEHLIHNRLISHGEGCDAVQDFVRSIFSVRGAHAHMLKELEREKKAFLVREYVPHHELGGNRYTRSGSAERIFLDLLLVRFDGNFLNDKDLEAGLALVRQFKPTVTFSSQHWTYLLSNVQSFSEEAHAAFCRELIRLPNPGLSAAGRYGNARRDYEAVKGTDQVTPRMLARMETARNLLRTAGALDFHLDAHASRAITLIKRDLEQFGKIEPPQPRPPLPPRPQRPEPGTGRLRFTKLDLRIREGQKAERPLAGAWWRSPGGHSSVTSLENCGDFDVMWGRSCLLYGREPGVLDVLVGGTDDPILDVKWDGAHLWVVTRTAGVHVRDPEGTVVHRIGKGEGLPPLDRGALLHAVQPGHVLAVGAFGINDRAWCAMLDIRAGTPSVNMFHTARRVVTSSDDKAEYSVDPGIVFRPHWIHEYDDGNRDSRTILVGRCAHTHEGRRRPLRIELPSLKVGVSEWELAMADHLSSSSYASHNGDLLEAGDFQVLWRKPVGTFWPGGSRWRHWCKPRNSEGAAIGGMGKVFLRHDGWLYAPGLMWFRVDPGTMREEKLTPGRLPRPYSGLDRFGVSAHFGILAWEHRGPYYRVDIKNPATRRSVRPMEQPDARE